MVGKTKEDKKTSAKDLKNLANQVKELNAKSKEDAEKVKEILTEAGSNFNTADPSTWAEQAQLAADGKFEELEKLKAELDGGKKVDE